MRSFKSKLQWQKLLKQFLFTFAGSFGIGIFGVILGAIIFGNVPFLESLNFGYADGYEVGGIFFGFIFLSFSAAILMIIMGKSLFRGIKIERMSRVYHTAAVSCVINLLLYFHFSVRMTPLATEIFWFMMIFPALLAFIAYHWKREFLFTLRL